MVLRFPLLMGSTSNPNNNLKTWKPWFLKSYIWIILCFQSTLSHIIWLDFITWWSRPRSYYYPDSTGEREALKPKWLRLTRVAGGTARRRISRLQMAGSAVFSNKKDESESSGTTMLQTYRLLRSLRRQFYRFLHTILLPLPLFVSFSNSKLSNRLWARTQQGKRNDRQAHVSPNIS